MLNKYTKTEKAVIKKFLSEELRTVSIGMKEPFAAWAIKQIAEKEGLTDAQIKQFKATGIRNSEVIFAYLEYLIKKV